MSVSSIEVRCGGKRRAVAFSDGETLLAALRNAGFSLSAACGGKGKCGKCRVRINGVQRLACRVAPAEGDVVELPETAGGAILTATVPVAAPTPVGAQEGIAAIDPNKRCELRSCAEKCQYIELSGLREFTEAFTDHITFDTTED